MTALQLLNEIAGAGVRVKRDGAELEIDAPAGVLTDELIATLRKRKADLLDLLAEENIEMHDSALFDLVVEVTYYTGERIRIPQQSTPAGWVSPF